MSSPADSKRVLVVDMGIKTEINEPRPSGSDGFINLAVARGTANFLHGPAMSGAQAMQALIAGRRAIADHLAPAGIRVVVLGEMGIGNTTSASALTAVLTGREAAAVTGRGTGLDDARLRHKIDVVDRAVQLHFPTGRSAEPMTALAALGGFEIAGLVGSALEAASRRMTIVLDGFISSIAGLLAVRINPAVRDYLVAGHRSLEAGHRIVFEALDLVPLLDLGLRLGEGSGAALALNLVQCSADLMREMATFEEAGIAT